MDDDDILKADQAAAERESQREFTRKQERERFDHLNAAWASLRAIRVNPADGKDTPFSKLPADAASWRDAAQAIVDFAFLVDAEWLRQRLDEIDDRQEEDTPELLALHYAFNTYRTAFQGDVDAVARRLVKVFSQSQRFREHFVFALLQTIPRDVINAEFRTECPKCRLVRDFEDSDRLCESCRFIDGTVAGFWAATHGPSEGHGRQPFTGIPVSIGGELCDEWQSILHLGHELSRRESRHDEYKLDPVEYLIQWCRHEQKMNRDDVWALPTSELLQVLGTAIGPPDKGPVPASRPTLVAPAKTWWKTNEPPPSTPFEHGPLEGAMKDVARWTERDSRTLKEHNGKVFCWIQKLSGRSYNVWFASRKVYEESNERRLREQNQGARKSAKRQKTT